MKTRLLRLAALAFLVLGLMGTVSAQSERLHYSLNGTCPPSDSSGNGFDGSCVDSPNTGVSGQFNDAYSFDGSNDAIDSTNDVFSPFTGSDSQLSVVYWFKSTTTKNARALSLQDSDSVPVIQSKPVKDDDGDGNAETVFYVADENGNNVKLVNQVDRTDGNWHMVVANIDGVNNDMELWVDNSKVEESTSAGWTGGFYDSSNSFDIGYFRDTGNDPTTKSEFFDGSIDEVRVYNGILSSSQIDKLYNKNSLNDPPTFDSVSTSPSSWTFGSDVDVDTNASDPDGTVQSVEADVYEGGNTVKSGVSLSEDADGNWTVTDLFDVDQVNTWYNITFTATDSNGATTTETVSQYISDSSPSFNTGDPENKTYGTQDLNWTLNETGDGDDVTGETLNVKIYEDGTQVGTDTITEGAESTGSWTSSDGKHTFKAELVEQDGDTTSKTVDFEVDTGFGDINITDPAENSTTKDLSKIWLNYTITNEPNLDSSSCQYSKDGGTNISISSCSNTTFQLGEVGTHNITLWAKDSIGNWGSETVEWFADQENTIQAEDSATGSNIQDFEVILDNGTETEGGSTSDGTFEFLTSKSPKGPTNLTISSKNYQTKRKELNITDNFSLDKTYSLTRSDLTFQVKSEKTTKKIEYNATVSNKTNTVDLHKYNTLGYSGSTNTVGETNTDTIFSYSPPDTFSADSLKFQIDNSQNDAGDYIEVFVNGNKVGQKDVAEGTFSRTFDFSGRTVNSIKIDYTNKDDGDSFDEPTDVKIEDTEFSLPDKNQAKIDFKTWTESGFPTGQVEFSVESKDFKPRKLYSEIDTKTSISLTSYLLSSNDGIYISTETYNAEGETVSGARLTVQKLFDGTYKTVAQETTATDGSASLFLDPDVNYKIIASHLSYSTFEGKFSPTNYQYDPLKIQLGSENKYNFSTRWDSVSYKLTPEKRFLNQSKVTKINWTVSDSFGKLTEFGLRLKYKNGTIIKDRIVRNSPSGGEVSINISGQNWSKNQDFLVESYFISDGKEYRIEKIYEFARSWTAGIFSLSKILDTNGDGLNDTPKGLFALIVTAVVGASLGKRFDKDGGGFIAVMVLGIFTIAKWFPFEIWTVTFLSLLGIYLYR